MTDDPMHHTEVGSAEPQPLHQARRCGAKTRSGRPCRSPAVYAADRGAGCTGARPALVVLRASATAITGTGSTRKRRGRGFGRCAIWQGRSKT